MDAIQASGVLAPQNPVQVTAHSVQRGQFSRFPLAGLPSEVLVKYLLPSLPLQDVYAYSSVSTRFRDMITGNDVDAISFCRNFCSPHIIGDARERYQTIFRPWLHQFGQSGREAMVKLDKIKEYLRFPQVLFFSIARTLGRAERFAVSQAGVFTENATIENLIFSPDGMHAIGRLSVSGVRLYRFVEGKWQSDTLIGPDTIVQCGFSADSSQVVTFSWNLRIRLHQLVDNRWQEQEGVECPDGLRFAGLSGKCQVAVSGNHTVIIYGYDGARWQQELKAECYYKRPKVIFSPNGKHVVLACNNLLMYELVDGTWQFQKIVSYVPPKPTAIVSVGEGYIPPLLYVKDITEFRCNDSATFSADGSCLLTHTGNFKVKVHCLVAGQWQESETLHLKGYMVSASFSQDRHHVMLRLDNMLVTFLSCVNGTWQVNTTIQHNSDVSFYSFSPDCVHAMTGCGDKTVRIFQQADGQWQEKTQIEINHDILHAQFSPCGTHIVVTTNCNDARIYGLVKGRWRMKCLILLELSKLGEAKFSPTGVYLSTTCAREVNFWRIKEDMSKKLGAGLDS